MVDEETRRNTSIQALPSPSQLDIAVLDSLPLAIKRELEVAYGTYPINPLPIGEWTPFSALLFAHTTANLMFCSLYCLPWYQAGH